jgi:hypothetical protein
MAEKWLDEQMKAMGAKTCPHTGGWCQERMLNTRIAELEAELNRESYRRNELISLICEVAGCAVEDIGLKWVDMQMDRDVLSKVLKVSHYPRPDSDGGL